MQKSDTVDRVTVRCPFCEQLFLMTRPLFTSERTSTACPACRAEAKANTEAMRRSASETAYKELSASDGHSYDGRP